MLGCVPETMFENGKNYHSVQHDISQSLPSDPRQWSRDHVTQWLQHARVQYQLGDTHPERFPLNGKALLLMTREMFLSRVPQGGGILFEDIQLKLQKVIIEMYSRVED